jgi:hypothetical protein
LYAIGVVYHHEFIFEDALVGATAIDKTGTSLPQQTLNLCLIQMQFCLVLLEINIIIQILCVRQGV